MSQYNQLIAFLQYPKCRFQVFFINTICWNIQFIPYHRLQLHNIQSLSKLSFIRFYQFPYCQTKKLLLLFLLSSDSCIEHIHIYQPSSRVSSCTLSRHLHQSNSFINIGTIYFLRKSHFCKGF